MLTIIMAAPMSKADYLQRYLSKKDGKKKKLKKPKNPALAENKKQTKKLKIFDDDIDMRLISHDEDNYVEIGEEAPEVIGVIDDRPEELRKLQEKNEGKWKTVGENEEDLIKPEINKWGVKKLPEKGSKSRRRHDSEEENDSRKSEVKKTGRTRHDSDSDNSPDRERKGNVDSDHSPPRSRTRRDSGSDQSPPRSRTRQDSDSDQSPPRSRAKGSDSDQSPPRSRVKGSDSDQSPPRIKTKHNSDSDQSPPRSRSNKSGDSDLLPFRIKQSTSNDYNKNERKSSKEKTKLEKTLDGKIAGLRNAKSLREENEAFKARENRQFEKMDNSISGRHAKTIVRDRSTGKIRNLEEEEKQKAIQDQIKAKREAKYQEWGRGLKQIDMRKSQLNDAVHEMNKPLARYENDVDLEQMLKEQDRDGDPMLEFLKKKKPKSAEKGGKVWPKYNGATPPPLNRFDIAPGYRWDGVDRSNGFEKARYDRINNKVAVRDEAYKWSVEDM